MTDASVSVSSSGARKLLVATGESIFSHHTAYTLLAKHTPNAKLIMAGHAPPQGIPRRALVWSISRLAFTRWYWVGRCMPN